MLGKEAVLKLKSTDPPFYLSPSADLSEAARLASEYLFSSLKPYAPKSPFTRLLVKGFDAEQIWQQIDIQSQPLISSLGRKVQNFEKNPEEIKSVFNALKNGEPVEGKGKDLGVKGEIEDEDVTAFDDDDDDDDDEEEEENEDDEQKLQEKGEEGGLEDKYFKMDELEDYLEQDEAREYGLKREKKKGKKRGHDEIADEVDEDEGEEGGDDADEDDDELGLMGLDDDEDDGGENARYQDFFGKNEKNTQKRKTKPVQVSDNLEMDEESSDDDKNQKNTKLSTHERELASLRSTVKEMEKANIEPKSWTMLGEVTASKRPKNSALEVALDIEHNMLPAPVITEESAMSLEDAILKKIMEGDFGSVQRPPTLTSRAPREVKELDENKSKKGLGDIYAEEYAEKTGLVSVAVSISEQQKKESKSLFKELCLKLDALSHFHFTPKPVIEDMAIQTNVPALAMEEIAPLAVSDAAMLAPEEVFAGKGDIKDETELTQAERKRRRANKKRKFKANEAKRVVKSQPTPQSNKDENDS